jgi:hypothetical protein
LTTTTGEHTLSKTSQTWKAPAAVRKPPRGVGDDPVMSDEITVVDATEELKPTADLPEVQTAYAWGSEAAEDFTEPADHVDQPARGAPVLAVAALAGIAFAVAAVAAVVVLVTPPRTLIITIYARCPYRRHQRPLKQHQRHPRQRCQRPWSSPLRPSRLAWPLHRPRPPTRTNDSACHWRGAGCGRTKAMMTPRPASCARISLTGGLSSRMSTAPSGSLRSCYPRRRGRLSRTRSRVTARNTTDKMSE